MTHELPICQIQLKRPKGVIRTLWLNTRTNELFTQDSDGRQVHHVGRTPAMKMVIRSRQEARLVMAHVGQLESG